MAPQISPEGTVSVRVTVPEKPSKAVKRIVAALAQPDPEQAEVAEILKSETVRVKAGLTLPTWVESPL
jgi:hypothetical protein